MTTSIIPVAYTCTYKEQCVKEEGITPENKIPILEVVWYQVILYLLGKICPISENSENNNPWK